MCFGPRRAELAVLDVLVPGAMLTADQIARQARLTRCRTRWAIARLERWGGVGNRPADHQAGAAQPAREEGGRDGRAAPEGSRI